jgi:hypothetical protein
MHESVSIGSTMLNSISIKLSRASQQKRTSTHMHNIEISNSMIRANGKMHSSSLHYLDHTAVVEPLNIVSMWMCSRSQPKLLDYHTVHQVVAATAVDDGENTTIIDDEDGVKQVVAFNLVRVIKLCAQRSLSSPVMLAPAILSS